MPADVTQEVWCPATSVTRLDDEGTVEEVGLGHVRVETPDEAFVIIIEKGVEHHRTIFSVPNDDPPGENDIARMHMAARAPTLYRLLEQVVQLGIAPRDLDEVIRINLHRAAPDVYPKPETKEVERRSAWQKLLGDDL